MWLVVLAVLASVVAASFYLRLIILMYVQQEEPAVELGVATRTQAPVATLAVAIPAAVTVLLGVFPQIVFGLLQTSSARL